MNVQIKDVMLKELPEGGVVAFEKAPLPANAAPVENGEPRKRKSRGEAENSDAPRRRRHRAATPHRPRRELGSGCGAMRPARERRTIEEGIRPGRWRREGGDAARDLRQWSAGLSQRQARADQSRLAKAHAGRGARNFCAKDGTNCSPKRPTRAVPAAFIASLTLHWRMARAHHFDRCLVAGRGARRGTTGSRPRSSQIMVRAVGRRFSIPGRTKTKAYPRGIERSDPAGGYSHAAGFPRWS